MSNFEITNILTISCNAIGTEEADEDANCIIIIPIIHGAGCEKYYTNARPENDKPEKSCTNTNSNSNCYPNTDSNSNALKSKDNYKEILKMFLVEEVALMEHFLCR